MKIRFTKKRLNSYLIYGILWLILGTFAIMSSVDVMSNYVYFLIIGLLYFGTYLFENSKQYLTIENGVLSKNRVIPKKINLNDITQIKKFAGDYILKTDTTELRINTQLIDKKSLSELDIILENLNLEAK